MSWYPTIMVLLATTAIIVAYLIGKDHGRSEGTQKLLDRFEDMGVIAKTQSGEYVVWKREDLDDDN